jgi:SAM-dependent methyltransferase
VATAARHDGRDVRHIMSDPVRHEVGRVRDWYNLVADAFVRRYEGESGWYLARCEEDLVHAVCDLDGRDVLDLGTGHGRLLPRLATRARRLVGVDLSEALLRRAPRARGIALAQMDALDLGFRAAAFDTVLCLGLFEYVEDLDPFLAEIARVTRAGGQVAFTYHQRARYRAVPDEPPHTVYFGRTVEERSRFWTKRRHRRAEVREALVQAGFRPARHYRLFFRASAAAHGLAQAWPERSLRRRTLRLAVPGVERGLGRSLRPLTQHSTGNVLVVAERVAATVRGFHPAPVMAKEVSAWR